MVTEVGMIFAWLLFGLIVGSFLNVVLLRMHTGRSLSGRSGCLSCRSKLSSVELVPVVSYLFLRGRCRHCGSRISVQYPLVELATAVAFAYVGLTYGVSLAGVFAAGMLAAMILIVVYDWRHHIIPDEFLLLLAVFSVGFLSVTGWHTISEVANAVVSGMLLALPFAALWVVSRGHWIGLADAKLAFLMGLFLGVPSGLVAVGVAAVTGACYGLLLWALTRLMRRLLPAGKVALVTLKTEVAFGPFLLFGWLAVWWWQVDWWYFSVLFGM